MMGMPYWEYVEHYRTILAELDPQRVFDKLGQLADNTEPILLCWERPPFTTDNWCHRRIVAEWFGETLGVDVPEHDATADHGRG